MANELLAWLVESAIASSVAIVLSLLLRGAVRRAFGARVAYALWWSVPAAWLATLLPAPVREALVSEPSFGRLDAISAVQQTAAAFDATWLLLPAWVVGMVTVVVVDGSRQRRFMRQLGPLVPRADGLLQARAIHGLPAVVGLRPRIVVPADFDTRYRDDERRLILAHERVHARRGDPAVQALLFAFRAVYWFNPLAWLAAERVRRDQELSCDASVVARHSGARRTYAEAMVKTSLAQISAPLACYWTGQHPLKERIAMLKLSTPSRRILLSGACAVVLLASGAGFATWALQTPRTRYVVAQADPAATGDYASPVVRRASPGVSPLNREITLHLSHIPLPDAARRIAELGGIRVVNPDDLGRHPVTLQFYSIRVATALRILADEAHKKMLIESGGVRFVEASENAPAATSARSAHGATSRQPAPPYPAAAVASGQSGRVVLLVDVNPDGSVADAKVETSTPPGVFDATTLEAAKKWTFRPTVKDGKAVAGRVRVPVDFDIDRPATQSPASPRRTQSAIRDLDPEGREFAWVKFDSRQSPIASMACDATEQDRRDDHVAWCGNRLASPTTGR